MVSARSFLDGERYLAGAYAPVREEHLHRDLRILEGELPRSLSGVFCRNASNPRFDPQPPYHWFDGDGMIHAVSFENGRASYRNRFVRTAGFVEDEAAGAATWRGLLARPDFERSGGPYKNTANTDVLYWNGQLLALWWLGTKEPYAVSLPDLETQGVFHDAGTLTAHAKVDPRTGDLIFIDYGPRAPYLVHGQLTTTGDLTRTPIELPGDRLQHDTAITERFTILLDMSMHADPEELKKGRVVVRFFRDVPTRFGIFDRVQGALVRWFEVEPCYIYHLANAWEQNGEVVVVGSRMCDPLMYEAPADRDDAVVPRISHLRLDPELRRWTFNLETGQAREETLDDGLAEFARVDDRLLGAPTKAAYLSEFAREETLRFAGVRRVDLDDGRAQVLHYPEGHHGGELVHLPCDEGDLLATFVTSPAGESEMWLLDERDLRLVCRLEIPSRVPPGYHACWVPGGLVTGV